MKIFITLIYFLTTFISISQIGEPHLQWVKEFIHTKHAGPTSIDVDNQGNIYVVGTFEDVLIANSTYDTHDFEISDNADGFILKMNKFGELLWFKQVMQNSTNSYINSQTVNSIKVNNNNELIISGSFFSSFKIKDVPASIITSSNGESDFYVLKLNTDGDFIWIKRVGGNSGEGTGEIAIDSYDNIYIPGNFNSTVDFNPNAGVANLVSIGGYSGPFNVTNDAYLLKLNTNGNFIWVKHIGGKKSVSGSYVTTDNDNNVYMIGTFSDTAYFDLPTSVKLISHSGPSFKQDIFITKFNSNGDLIWAKQQGGTSQNKVSSIVVDDMGDVYTTGGFRGTMDFDPGLDNFDISSYGFLDIYVSKLDVNGDFVWAKAMLGDPDGDFGATIDLDSDQNIYISGMFRDTVDFDPGAGEVFLVSEAYHSMFLQKLDSNGSLIWVKKTDGFDGPGNFKMVGDNTFYFASGYLNSLKFHEFHSIVELTNEKALYVMKLKQGFTEIDEGNQKNKIVAFPNPTSDNLFFNTENNLLIKIFNIGGEEVLRQTGKSISLKSLTSGLYFVKVYSPQNELIKVQKIIKKN